jgi:hypothetical protein
LFADDSGLVESVFPDELSVDAVAARLVNRPSRPEILLIHTHPLDVVPEAAGAGARAGSPSVKASAW